MTEEDRILITLKYGIIEWTCYASSRPGTPSFFKCMNRLPRDFLKKYGYLTGTTPPNNPYHLVRNELHYLHDNAAFITQLLEDLVEYERSKYIE